VPVIFRNPAGAPELACDECGCRWFDRMTGACYECGAAVSAAAQAEFAQELAAFAARRAQATAVADNACHGNPETPE
jgi:hypothetical protein